MKKILSFLTKKPLALAAVALFSMSSFAQETGAPKEEGTTETTKPTATIWQKVSEANPLYYFDMVTVVDEDENKVYADDGTNQVDAKDFLAKDEDGNFVPGTTVPEDASFFYVAEGSSPDFFALNKSLKKNADGKYVNKAGEVVSDEDVAVGKDGKGAMGDGLYLHETGDLKSSSLWSTVSWKWEDMTGSSEYYLFSAANFDRFIAYNSVAKRFEYSPDADNSPKAKLYKAVKKYLPYFDPEEGVVTNPEEGWSVSIINENPDGTIWYREKGDDEWTEYTGPIPVSKLDEEITFETYIEFEGGSTGKVEATYLLTEIAAPEFDPATGLKIDNDGNANVTISSEEGTGLDYTVACGDETEPGSSETNEATVNLAKYVDQVVQVTATATKTVKFKGEDVDVESDPATAEYIIEPNATAEDLELELVADPVSGSEVSASQLITLYWTINNDEYDYYTLAPNPEKTKEIKLTFHTADGDVDEIVTDVDINKKGQFVFRAPKGYYNTEFDVEVVEGFYTAKSGKNEIPTPESQVSYKMGPGQTGFTVDTDPTRNKWSETREQPSDDISYVVQIYPGTDEDAVCDFANPSQEESNYGAWLAKAQDELTATIKKVEKVAEPNFFEITFTDDEALHEAIVYYLENVDEMIEFGGYSIGFPAGTFKSGEYVNKEDVTHHVKFIESVDIQLIPVEWLRCEGSIGVELFVKATGKVLGTNFNAAYPSDEESQIEVDPEAVVKITGTDIHGDDVDVEAKITRDASETFLKKYKSKDVFYLTFGAFALQEDGGEPYTVTVPADAFKVNSLSTSEKFEGKLDIMAHPVWTATARPYSYDEGKKSASTLTLDVTVTLDDLIPATEEKPKLFEKDPRPNKVKEEGETESHQYDIFVDGEAVESWTMGELSAVALDENERPFKTYTLTLNLKTPIADVAKHDILIPAHAFLCNACDNKDVELSVQPNVTYKIQKIKYIIPTTQESVTYEIWGILPDGSFVDAPIDYVGETDPEARNIFNALRYNNAQFKELDETLSEGEQYVSEKDAFYPKVESTEYNADKKTTTFTISFPEGLVVNNYKMTFPAGTVQAQGYNDNADRLYNPFDVVPAYFYDATSSEEDYQKPAETPKDKVYNISTSTKQITLYLTAADLDEDDVTGNANNDILLLDGTQLTVENEKINEVVEWKHEEGGIFTVTLPEISENGGLEPGTYTLTIPDLSFTTNKIFSVVSTPTPGLYNQEVDEENDLYPLFQLTINVEDFAGPDDQPIEITTKQFAFEVPIDGLTEVLEPAASFDNGTPATLSTEEEGVLIVTIGGAKPLVKGAEHNFLHSGDYVLTIPAGAFKGQYATSYEDIDVDVKVIFEFVDYIKEDADVVAPKYKDLTTSTEAEVVAEVGEHEKMYFTRNLGSTNPQGLAVPFELTEEEVADYFSIYKVQAVTVADDGKFKLNWIPTATAYANKPYIMVPAEAQGLVSIALGSEDEPKVVETPAVAEDIKASTTMVRFDFLNAIEPMEFAEKVHTFGVTTSGDLKFGTSTICNPWRWYMTSSDKEVEYIKIAINGVDIDDATGIDFVEAAEGDAQIFNVAGQRLNAAAKGKVNIINGKKVFVK